MHLGSLKKMTSAILVKFGLRICFVEVTEALPFQLETNLYKSTKLESYKFLSYK